MSSKQVTPYQKRKVLIDKKYSFFVYLVVLVLAVLCRISQLKNNMNFATGKYIDDSPFKNLTMMVMIVGFVLIGVVVFLGEARDKTIKSCVLINPIRLPLDQLAKKVPPIGAAAMLVMAALLAFESLFPLITTMNNNIDRSTDDNPVPLFEGVTGSEWVLYILMLFLLITFVFTGINILKSEGITPGNCFFFTLFPIWKLYHIFVFIGEQQLIGPYSEKCYVLFTDIISGVFFLFTVRFFSGFEKKHTRLLLIFFGYVASIVAAVSVVPRYAMYFMLDYSVREGMLAPGFADIGMIFVPIAVTSVFWSNYTYRNMPKLSIEGQRRWTNMQTEGYGSNEMESIDEE